MAELNDPTVARETALRISDKPLPHYKNYGLQRSSLEDHGTGQVAVLGPSGDAVIMVGTLNWA